MRVLLSCLLLAILAAFVWVFRPVDGGGPESIPGEGARPEIEPAAALRKLPAPTDRSDAAPLPDSTPPDPGIIRQKLFSNPKVLAFTEDWRARELTQVKYVHSIRKEGKEVIAVLPPVPSGEGSELNSSIEDLVGGAFPEVSAEERRLLQSTLLEWISPHSNERVVIVRLLSDPVGGREKLIGRWLDVEDSTKILDEFQYVDYGKILDSRSIPDDIVSERYGHLVSIQDDSTPE